MKPEKEMSVCEQGAGEMGAKPGKAHGRDGKSETVGIFGG